jgi:hypothetical protein
MSEAMEEEDGPEVILDHAEQMIFALSEGFYKGYRDYAEKEGLIIIWLAISTSFYKRTEISKYHAANDPNKPLDSLSSAKRNKELHDICEKIKDALDR